MNICNNCGNQIDGLPFKCKYCGLDYCPECRLPEYHNCVGLKIHKEKLQNKFVRNASSLVNDHYVVNDRGFNQIEDKKRSKIGKQYRSSPVYNKDKYQGNYSTSSPNTPSMKKSLLCKIGLHKFGKTYFDSSKTTSLKRSYFKFCKKCNKRVSWMKPTRSIFDRIFDAIYNIIALFCGFAFFAAAASVMISGFEPTIMYPYTYSKNPDIYGADYSETLIINEVLNNTDKQILHHINKITVTEDIDSDIVEAAGCASSIGNSPLIRTSIVDIPFFYSEIQVIPISNYYATSEYVVCSSFEYTLQHEIGHVKGHIYNDDSEEYAELYAQTYTKNKGEC